jgi:glycosyltransferase involved in cell wall biosynthesis
MIDPEHPDFANTPVSPRRPRRDYVPADPSAVPAVTIVTPFYNTGDMFEETARSVLRQSFQQWEWIIVNDGSTDAAALSVLAPYRVLDPRIRVIDHESNRGLPGARNTGFRAARAPYVVQLDSDDLLEPTAVEQWWWCLESYPELAFVKGYSVGFGAENYLWRRGFHEGPAFLRENLVDATSMIRVAVHRAVGGADERIRAGLEDWDFWLRCANGGFWGGTIPEYLNWYRRRPGRNLRWSNLADPAAFRAQLRHRYPRLWERGFPDVESPNGRRTPSFDVPDVNRLGRRSPALLMVVPWLTVGGAEKFNLDLLRELSMRGWVVTVAATRPGDDAWLSQFHRHTPDVFVLHHFLRLQDHPRFLRYLIASRGIDVVLVTNSLLGYQLLPHLRAEHPDVTLVTVSHVEERWRDGGFPGLSVAYEELLDLNVVVSRDLERWMLDRNAEPGRVRVCHAGVDAERWRPDAGVRATVRAGLGVGEGVTLLLYVGRLCPQKQPRVFARTVRDLARRGKAFVAIVAGDGPDREWLDAFLRDEGLEGRVRVFGAVSADRVCELMQAADLLFLPSQYEGIPLVVYEAMATGLCVVAADVGGLAEALTPDCGLLIRPGSEEEEAARYTDALSSLLDDPERVRRMGAAGRERAAAHFQVADMGIRMDGLLREALTMHRDRPRPVPGRGLGRACAAEAVEAARVAGASPSGAMAEALAPPGLRTNGDLLDPYRAPARTLAYFTLRAVLGRYYRTAASRPVFRWLVGLKERTKRHLLQRA